MTVTPPRRPCSPGIDLARAHARPTTRCTLVARAPRPPPAPALEAGSAVASPAAAPASTWPRRLCPAAPALCWSVLALAPANLPVCARSPRPAPVVPLRPSPPARAATAPRPSAPASCDALSLAGARTPTAPVPSAPPPCSGRRSSGLPPSLPLFSVTGAVHSRAHDRSPAPSPLLAWHRPGACPRAPDHPLHARQPRTVSSARTRARSWLRRGLPRRCTRLHLAAPPPPSRARALPERAGTRARQPPCARSLPSPCPRRSAAPVAACTCGHRASPVRPGLLRRTVARRRRHAHGSGPLRPAALFRSALVRPLAAGARTRLCRVTWAGYTRTPGLRPVSPAPTPATPNTR
nr:translation initiation factor IF-2-like [Aegilops tauschii subsp. strangulata]